MIRLLLPTAVGLVMFAVWLFAVLDVITTDEMLIRNLPKVVWLFLVVLIPPVGVIAWFAGGRPVGAGLRPGTTRSRPTRTWQDRPRARGVEDRDDWRPDTHPSPPPEDRDPDA